MADISESNCKWLKSWINRSGYQYKGLSADEVKEVIGLHAYNNMVKEAIQEWSRGYTDMRFTLQRRICAVEYRFELHYVAKI